MFRVEAVLQQGGPVRINIVIQDCSRDFFLINGTVLMLCGTKTFGLVPVFIVYYRLKYSCTFYIEKDNCEMK